MAVVAPALATGPAAAEPAWSPGETIGRAQAARAAAAEAALDRLDLDSPGTPVTAATDPRTGTATSVVTDVPFEGDAAAFTDYAGVFGVTDPTDHLRPIGAERREFAPESAATSHWYEQVVDGVPVRNARVGLHLDQSGERLQFISNGLRPDLVVPATTPAIDAERAVAEARRALPSDADAELVEAPELFVEPGTPDPSGAVLADLVWEVWLRAPDRGVSQVYLVDATGVGGVLATEDQIRGDVDRRVYDLRNGPVENRTLVRTEDWSSDRIDYDGEMAYLHTGVTYYYFQEHLGRDSFDDAGATLVSNVHAVPPGGPNAWWDGAEMSFTDGMVVADVTAHELTHAVTTSTADLVYKDQPGALNESFSDIFGEMTEREMLGSSGWELGTDSAVGAIRSLSDPEKYGQPAHMRDYQRRCDDGGGVHRNSGIPNRAFVNAHNALGAEKSERIFYRALSQYLFPTANFADAVNATVAAAMILYGKTDGEAEAIEEAWRQVGVTNETPPSDSSGSCTCVVDSTLRTATLDQAGPEAAEIRAALYLARDVLPRIAPAVSYYVNLYNDDSPLLNPLLNDDPVLNEDFGALLQVLYPLFLAAAGEGDPATPVTAEQLAAVDAFFADVRAADQARAGGGALSASIDSNWRALDLWATVGLRADDALAELNRQAREL
ncbi:hypothetical protein GCM10022245_59210 [Streptomyces mayteni]